MYNHIINIYEDIICKLFNALQVSEILGITSETFLHRHQLHILDQMSCNM